MLDKNRSEKGFTIVEVMIVLAIAGLVLAIVFVAVPALRRNANNSGRSADVGQIATAISNYSANRNGKLPNTINEVTHVTGNALDWAYYQFDGTAAINAIQSDVGTATNTEAEDVHKLYYFAKTAGEALAATSLTNQALPSPDEVHIWSGYKCLDAPPTAGNPEANTTAAVKYTTTAIEKGANRDVAIVYQPEGQATALCLDDV